MGRRLGRAFLIASLVPLFGCGRRPPEFREVTLAEAQQTVRAEQLTVVEAFSGARDAEAGAAIHGGGVLVFGLDAKAARARAAIFARAGNHPVLVFIPRDADERGKFYAVASRRQEDRRGRDS